MERIRYITPSGDSPKGKNYIFFAAHPEDAKHCFSIVKQEIFQIEENCAIWYDATPEKPCNAAFWEELQLLPVRQIIVWITSRLLDYSGSFVRDLLRYASKQKIGVLPLIRESGLESKYQQHFGNIQYLDATDYDPTAIPYEEKLKRQLQTIMTSAEDFQRIRDAFAGYIFLSYRKKDRALANQLMKRIHECQSLQDVAIWYDEFLVPGEDFNDGIQAAMENSDLFALLVTQNLLEPGNYVLKKEFPAARDAGMEILPIQMNEVGHGLLRDVYDQLPKKVNGNDRSSLEQALCDKLSLPEKTEDPEHAYLIGLAYWNGIDVVQNPQRGLELITGAAKAGVADAIQTLADIYKSMAFAVYYDESTKTYSQLHCQIREYLYRQGPTTEKALELVQAYLRMSDLECISQGDPVVALECCGKAKALLEKLVETSGERAVYHGLVDTYGTTACTLSAIDKISESMAEFLDGEALCEKLYVQTGEAEFLWKKGRLQQKMAETLLDTKHVREAMRACRRCKETGEKLKELGYAVWSNRLLRDLYELFARVYAALDNAQQKEQAEGHALRYAKEAAQASGNQIDYLQYIRLLDEQGEVCLAKGETKKAALYYEGVADACRMIKTDWLPEGIQRRYVKILTNQGQSLYHAKEYEKAAEVFAEAYGHALSLMNTTKDVGDQYNCVVLLYLWGCTTGDDELLAQSKQLLMPLRRQYPADKDFQQYENILNNALKKR